MGIVRRNLWYPFLFVVLFISCLPIERQMNSEMILFEDSFKENLDQWVIEQQPGGKTFIGEQGLEIIDSAGCTIWFKEKLYAPLSIQYEVEVVGLGGPFDRVSDLNCFWMANDPHSPNDFFKHSKKRAGKFTNYHTLTLYYVGYGGHHNSKTRFRRYNGSADRPLKPEHDLNEPKYLIQPNRTMLIELRVKEGIVEYLRDNEVVFAVADKRPHESGYFGFRTVNNHMIIKNFKVFGKEINPKPALKRES